MTKASNALGIEEAKIITLSVAHLHPETIAAIEGRHGDIPEGPSIAVREQSFLVNSMLNTDDALAHDLQAGRHPAMNERFPDLVLICALARGLKAEWINLDNDGVQYCDILPTYVDYELTLPSGEGWRDALSTIGKTLGGEDIVVAERAILEAIEAGQTPCREESPHP